MELSQDQESRKSPSDHSTESFEQLESLVSREEELQVGTNFVPTTTATNLNLDLLTEETGEGLPLNMQLSMTTSDHSTPDAPKPSLLGELPGTPSKSTSESAPNEPGGGDATVPTSPPLPQVEEDDNFYHFESRYESKKQETLEEHKIVESELIQRSSTEEEILERDIIKEECPLTKSFIEEEEVDQEKDDDILTSPAAFEVLRTKIEEEVKREIAEVQREVLEDSANVRKLVEEPKVQSVQSSVVESPNVIPSSSLPEKEEEEDHPVVVEPHLRTSSSPLTSPPITAPSFSSKLAKPGPISVPEQLEKINPTTQESVKTFNSSKSAMDEANQQDCPFKTIGKFHCLFTRLIYSYISLHHVLT